MGEWKLGVGGWKGPLFSTSSTVWDSPPKKQAILLEYNQDKESLNRRRLLIFQHIYNNKSSFPDRVPNGVLPAVMKASTEFKTHQCFRSFACTPVTTVSVIGRVIHSYT